MRVIQSFCALEQGEAPCEPFVLLEEEKPLSAEKKLFLVCDPFHLEVNSRKLLSALYQRIEEALASDASAYAEWTRLATGMLSLLDESCRSFLADITHDDEIPFAAFCKCIGLRFDKPHEGTMASNLCWLMDVLGEWAPSKLLVLCNVSPFLTCAQRSEVLKYACYSKIQLLMIDTTLSCSLDPREIRWRIDKEYDDVILRL